MSAATCRNGRGRPQLTNPHSALEAMSMVAYARERVRLCLLHTVNI